MHTDIDGAHFSCYVCSLLGAVSIICFTGQHNKGYYLFADIRNMYCFVIYGLSNGFFVFFFLANGYSVIYLYAFFFSLSLPTTYFLVVQVWAATQSGNLETTYTHTEEHVCWQFSLFTLKLLNCEMLIFAVRFKLYLCSLPSLEYCWSWYVLSLVPLLRRYTCLWMVMHNSFFFSCFNSKIILVGRWCLSFERHRVDWGVRWSNSKCKGWENKLQGFINRLRKT